MNFNSMRRTWILVASLAAFAYAAPVAAQDDAPPAEEQDSDAAVDAAINEAMAEQPSEDAPPAEGAPAEGQAAAPAADAAEGGEEAEVDALPALDPDDPMYWAEVRDVYTVQKRAFRKEGRFGVTLYGGLIPNNIFEQYFPVGLRLDYFILENIGIELSGSYAFRSSTRLESLLKEESGVRAQQILIGDTQLSHTNFGIVWSPFYGKTAFYNDALNYFDLYLFAGAGIVVTQTQPEFNAPKETEIKEEGALGGGLAYYLGEHGAIRLDFRQFVFRKVAGIGGVANPSEVSLGFGYFF